MYEWGSGQEGAVVMMMGVVAVERVVIAMAWTCAMRKKLEMQVS